MCALIHHGWINYFDISEECIDVIKKYHKKSHFFIMNIIVYIVIVILVLRIVNIPFLIDPSIMDYGLIPTQFMKRGKIPGKVRDLRYQG